MDISKLNKAEVLMVLYNASQVQGLGILQATGKPMTIQEAKKELEESDDMYFDYLHGKVMKISLQDGYFNTRLYNRDNGEGAAEKALNSYFKLSSISKLKD